jgi:phage terminase small subunit
MTLTTKQRVFCELYAANGGNGTKAAIGAGYSEETAQQMASENLSKPLIIEYLKSLTNAQDDERIATAIDRQRFWTSVMLDKNEKMDYRIKTSEILGKAQGDFINRIESVVTLENLSDEELDAKINAYFLEKR